MPTASCCRTLGCILQLTYTRPQSEDTGPLDVRVTEIFEKWFAGFEDRTTRIRVQIRIDRLRYGNFGSHRQLGAGIGELKLDFGPGYRLYFLRKGETVVLLCGGNKATQRRDLARAARIAAQLDVE